MRQFRLVFLLSFWLLTAGTGWAQQKPAAVAEFNDFGAKPLDGWEWDDDERLGDLIAQLREKESSLEALDARIAKAMGKKSGAKMDENMAWRNNNRMELNGGGPIRWDAFYGRNAEKFFYHPVDPNTTYHTNTLLQQTSPTAAGGVPGNQGVPAHQRPPQFDYIYRGWEKEQQRAKEKAEELKGRIDEMVSRRRDLEQDVVVLWCKLAFRIFDKEKLSEKPVLRWAAIPKSPDAAADVERAAVLTKASQLLATALLFNESFIEQDAPKAFSTVDAVIKKSRRQFEDGLLETETLLEESDDMGNALGKYKRLSRKLEDISKSLTEGYKGWREGDITDDEPAKYASLRRIQDSVVTYSQILLSLNELVSVMKKEWGTKINTKSTEFAPVWDVAYKAPLHVVRPSAEHAESAEPRLGRPSKVPKEAIKFRNNWYLFSQDIVNLSEAQEKARVSGGQLVVIDSAEENEFIRKNIGDKIAWLGLVKASGGWVTPASRPAVYFNWFPGQPSGNPGEDGVAIWPNGKWHDHLAHERRKYVIEW